MRISITLTQKLQEFYFLLQEYYDLDTQNHCNKIASIEQLLQLIPTLIAIDDEELYSYWKAYQQEERKWNQITVPNYTQAKGEAYPAALQTALDHLVIIIKAAQTYLKGYQEHKDNIVGEIMQKRFKDYADYIQKSLEAPHTGWLFLQTFFQQTQQLQQYTSTYSQLQITWKTRVIPNANALLTDEQDVATAQQILQQIQALQQFFQTAHPIIKKKYQKWEALANSGKWEKRLEDIKRKLARSQQRQQATLKEGNPKVAEQKNYSYQSPPKKTKLYKKGKGDQEAIAANDIQQGDLDNCYVLSPLAALAQSNPQLIRDMIKEQADGSFEVILYLRKSPDNPVREKTVVQVKREFLYDKNGNAAYAKEGDQELWVQVVEKAYAQALGEYDAIAEGGSPQETFEVLTGRKVEKGKVKDKTVEDLQAIFGWALKEKKMITISSILLEGDLYSIKIEKGQKLISNHNYYLGAIEKNSISLKNPTGKEHLIISWKALLSYFTNYFIA